MAFDKRSGFFFVSATGDGSIYRGKLGDTATPVPVFIPGAAGQSATGLKVQHGKLYAAGAATGTIKVYDVDSGTLLATFDTKGGDSSPTFVNDLDVTKRGDVYATDSKRPAIYHLTAEEIAAGTPAPKPIDPGRRHLDVARDPLQRRRRRRSTSTASSSTTTAVTTRAATTATVTATTAIGAPTSSSSSTRTPGSSSRSRSARTATPRARSASSQVDGGPFTGGDGLLIDRGQLLVVQGSNPDDGFPNGVVDFIDLRHGGRNGELADQRTDASFQGPSTIARARDRYLVVNPDFATSTPPFTVTALPR